MICLPSDNQTRTRGRPSRELMERTITIRITTAQMAHILKRAGIRGDYSAVVRALIEHDMTPPMPRTSHRTPINRWQLNLFDSSPD